MASYLHLVLCVFFFVTFHSFLISSRIDPNLLTFDPSSTLHNSLTILNVSVTLLSHDHPTTLLNSTANKSITLPLYSQDLISSTRYKDYRALTLARFERDDARLRTYYATKIDPIDFEFEGPIFSIYSSGMGNGYMTKIGVGSPPMTMNMMVDTGSDLSWVQCYDPGNSSTYSLIDCNSPYCKALMSFAYCTEITNLCGYNLSYLDNSTTEGELVFESVSVGNSPHDGALRIAIGCATYNDGVFSKAVKGILGLGGGLLSFTSQINALSFSYCLVNRDSSAASTLTLVMSTLNEGNEGDDYGKDELGETQVTAPLLRSVESKTYHYAGIVGISVAQHMVPIPPLDENTGSGGVVIDSGTAITRLSTVIYNSVRDAFVAAMELLPNAEGLPPHDTCYDLSDQRVVTVPAMSLHFPGGGLLPLPINNFIVPVDSTGTFCLAFAPISTPFSILGSIQEQGMRVDYDLLYSAIQFTTNQC